MIHKLWLNNLWVQTCDLKIRTPCEFFEFIEAPIEESIIIFHACSSNVEVKLGPEIGLCIEEHTGNTPRSIMTSVDAWIF